jgi:hypothetical protein
MVHYISVSVYQITMIPRISSQYYSREILPDSSAFTPSGAVMERMFIGVLVFYFGADGVSESLF